MRVISSKGRYGLKAMLDLAQYGQSSSISIKSISQRHHISENYLEQLMAVLKKEGFVKSRRGAQGGYTLASPPEQITVGSVLKALEGNLYPVDCIIWNQNKVCEEEACCITKYLWEKISDSILNVVDNITLWDMLHESTFQERRDL